jgi:hypothetical protein
MTVVKIRIKEKGEKKKAIERKQGAKDERSRGKYL